MPEQITPLEMIAILPDEKRAATAFFIPTTKTSPTMNVNTSSIRSLTTAHGRYRGDGTLIPKNGLSQKTGGKYTARY
ncbi:MAG: hypothetical protein LBM69_02505 [Lachnospiraceae bacterium]|jgi:hypothetical protein|nr:hypothetical protein [Lachnospiraceae bacterium]